MDEEQAYGVMKRVLHIVAALALTGTLGIPSARAAVVGSDTCSALGVHLTGVAPALSCWSTTPGVMSTGEERLNGITDWLFGQGISFGPSGSSLDTGIDLGFAASSGAAGGSWSMNPDALTPFSHLLMMFRSGETFFSYLFDGPSPDGAWSNTDGQSVDEVMVFVSPATEAPTAVPLPASLALLFGGLGALGLAARRRRDTAAA